MRDNPGCPLALNTLRRHGHFGWDPKPDVYRRLYADPAFRQRASRCSDHRGDWKTVIPAVASLLAITPDDASLEQIADRAKAWPAITALGSDDRHLALALLDWYSPIEIALPYERELIAGSGQHRICWARIADAERVPVWCKPYNPPPPGAAPAQPVVQQPVDSRGRKGWRIAHRHRNAG